MIFREWFFVFKEGTTIFSPFLKKGFGHVYAFSLIEDRIIVVNPHRAFIELLNVSYEDGFMPDSLMFANEINDKNTAIVKILVEQDISERHISLANMFPSCVNLVKMVSLYRSWAQTPFQLYKSLLKNGAERI